MRVEIPEEEKEVEDTYYGGPVSHFVEGGKNADEDIEGQSFNEDYTRWLEHRI